MIRDAVGIPASSTSPTTTESEVPMLDLYAPPIGPDHTAYVAAGRDAPPTTCGALSPVHPAMVVELACTLLSHPGGSHAHHLPDGTQLARWAWIGPECTDRVRVWTPAGAIVVGRHHRWLPIDAPATPAQIGALT